MKNLIFITIILVNNLSLAQQMNLSLSIEELLDKLKNDKNFILLDVRTTSEVNGQLKMIDGAINIPIQELVDRYVELNKFKDKEIIVICRTQNRSSAANEFLNSKGFKAKFVKGGMIEYYSKINSQAR
jgi:rhodanese-related sulfurtransferase